MSPRDKAREMVAGAILQRYRERAVAKIEAGPEEHAAALADAVMALLSEVEELLMFDNGHGIIAPAELGRANRAQLVLRTNLEEIG